MTGPTGLCFSENSHKPSMMGLGYFLVPLKRLLDARVTTTSTQKARNSLNLHFSHNHSSPSTQWQVSYFNMLKVPRYYQSLF